MDRERKILKRDRERKNRDGKGKNRIKVKTKYKKLPGEKDRREIQIQ